MMNVNSQEPTSGGVRSWENQHGFPQLHFLFFIGGLMFRGTLYCVKDDCKPGRPDCKYPNFRTKIAFMKKQCTCSIVLCVFVLCL